MTDLADQSDLQLVKLNLNIKIVIQDQSGNQTQQLIQDFDVSDCLDDSLSINLKKLVLVIKNQLNYALQNKEIYFYLDRCQIYMNCGIDPIHDDIKIRESDYKNRKFIIVKAKDLGISMVHRLMSFQSTINNGEQKQKGGVDQMAEKSKCRRTKERRIGHIIDKVIQWRKFYSGALNQKNQLIKYSLEDAAKQVKISKKSLDDYLFQIRFGHSIIMTKLGFLEILQDKGKKTINLMLKIEKFLVKQIKNNNILENREAQTKIFLSVYLLNYIIYVFICNCQLNQTMKFVNKSKTGKRSFNNKQSKTQIKNSELSRKQMRKMIRKQKKQRNKHFHQNHQHHQSSNQKYVQIYNHSKKNNNVQHKIQKSNMKVQKNKKQIKKQSQIDPQILQEQQQIKFYQKKLGITQKGNKYKNLMKGMGYDDDLFDFLQNISKKVKMNKNEYQAEKQEVLNSEDHSQMSQHLQQQEEFQQIESQQNFQQSQNNLNQNSKMISENQEQVDEISNNINQNIDHYDSNYWPEGFKPFNQKDQSQNNYEDVKNKKQKQPSQQIDRKKLFQLSNKQQSQQFQIKKSFTSLFNKLSDGNIMITFRQMRQIFSNHSPSNSIPVFIKLFLKFNVQVEKPHLHILLSNIVLSAGLHQLLGNRLMAPLVAQLIDRFNLLENQTQDQTQIQQIGYSKIFQKSKNCIIILSYLYEFGSLTGDFILSFVKQLSKELSKTHIQFLYLIIQKIGNKIRQNDPAVLKNIIEQLKTAISSFKIKQSEQVSEQITKKIDIIQIQLNELRFNRKNETFNDQRMAFFYTFINKNIPAEITSQKQIFLLNYEQIKLATKNKTNWWQTAEFNSKLQFCQENGEQLIQLDKDKQQLLALAKSLHLVTQIRKNIFLQIMQSQDYIQASQRVLSLKIKNMQQIATVLVQVCVLEPTFNPFYPLVAAKIANIIPKFRVNIQYGIWDHIKLIDQYDLRKTSNLAKFCSRFVSNPMSNGSLSILKTFADLINVSPSVTLFLKVFFKQFLKNVKKPYLAQLSKKLQEQNNRGIKQGIQQYLAQIGLRQKSFGFEQKMKVLRKLLSIQRQDRND